MEASSRTTACIVWDTAACERAAPRSRVKRTAIATSAKIRRSRCVDAMRDIPEVPTGRGARWDFLGRPRVNDGDHDLLAVPRHELPLAGRELDVDGLQTDEL